MKSWIVPAPIPAMVARSSAVRRPRTSAAPSLPLHANPHSTGRPTKTARAPMARAAATLSPERSFRTAATSHHGWEWRYSQPRRSNLHWTVTLSS